MAPKTGFAALGLDDWLLSAISFVAINEPTPVQQQCIPAVLRGQHVLAQSRTGTGKTLAFTLPILQSICHNPRPFHTLVITPTRELAIQIAEQVTAVGTSGLELRLAVLVGGTPRSAQQEALDKKPHVVIGTPGRVLDLFPVNHAPKIQFLVLDEADRLLEESYATELSSILAMAPDTRRTLTFTATMTENITKLIDLNEDNVFVFRETATEDDIRKERFQLVESLEQRFLYVPEPAKDAFLVYLLKNRYVNESLIIFTNTQMFVGVIVEILEGMKVEGVVGIHAGMSMTERMTSLISFRGASKRILVATDIGSRGLDIPHVDLVIMYDMPCQAADYIHRCGRTARASKSGLALSMICSKVDISKLHDIEDMTERKAVALDMTEEEETEAQGQKFLSTVNFLKKAAMSKRIKEKQLKQRTRNINEKGDSGPGAKRRKGSRIINLQSSVRGSPAWAIRVTPVLGSLQGPFYAFSNSGQSTRHPGNATEVNPL